MKTTCMTLLMFLLIQFSWAQNKNLDYSKAIKLYNQSTYNLTTKTYDSNDSTGFYLLQTDKRVEILQTNFAFQWKTKKNNFHEIQLIDFRIKQQGVKSEQRNENTNDVLIYNGQYIKETAIALGYEYIINFNKKSDRKIVPSMGFGGSPYLARQKKEPYLSNSFPVIDTRVGLRLFVSPRVSYYFNSKFFLDLHIPICISDMNVRFFKVDNPAFTKSQQTTNTVDFSHFPKYFSGRIDLGLKL